MRSFRPILPLLLLLAAVPLPVSTLAQVRAGRDHPQRMAPCCEQGASPVRATPNDQRSPAGRVEDGVLHVELEAVEAAWYPRGEDGPRIVTPAFAEVGREPTVPGPFIRAPAGTPVVVTVHNRLAHPIEGPVLKRHPDLRIWLMHAPGAPEFMEGSIALMRDYPNVYAEMSIVNSIASEAKHSEALRAFLDAGLLDRIMFGSDNEPFGPIIERIDAVPFLTAAQKRAIYCHNAARFLRLDGATCTAPEEPTR